MFYQYAISYGIHGQVIEYNVPEEIYLEMQMTFIYMVYKFEG